jgi:hypothetical protein
MIRLNREMIIEDILSIRASVPVENDEAREKIDKLISFLSTLPNDEKQSQFPKPSMRRL